MPAHIPNKNVDIGNNTTKTQFCLLLLFIKYNETKRKHTI